MKQVDYTSEVWEHGIAKEILDMQKEGWCLVAVSSGPGSLNTYHFVKYES